MTVITKLATLVLVSIATNHELLICPNDHWGQLYKLPESLECDNNRNYIKWTKSSKDLGKTATI